MSKYLIDSYGWIEALTNGPKARLFANYITSNEELITCGIVLAEIAAKFHSTGRGANAPAVLASIRQRAKLVELNEEIADFAGQLWAEHHSSGMGLADAVILAVAVKEHAIVLTGDSHFKGFKNAKVV